MSRDELLSILNENRKKLFTIEDISGEVIKVTVLKKIDEVFKKGLEFYLDYTPINFNSSTKVFFRKKSFHSKLSIEDKRIVDSFESLKSLLDSYRVLTDSSDSSYPLKGEYTIKDNPKTVAEITKNYFLPEKNNLDHRQFLKDIISKLAAINVYVFEFVETWNKKNKATIDGVYIDPNVIVLKRQKSYKREIFTLAHEIGHYLLGIEDIETLDMSKLDQYRHDSKVEEWCNNFAFYLIAGDAALEIDNFKRYSEDLNQVIDRLSKLTHISRMAWYTRLAYKGVVPVPLYKRIIRGIEEEYAKKIQEEKEKQKENPSGARTPKPIISPLYQETMQLAFYNGLISETTFCENLKISHKNIDKYL